jgi:hypothetical protein
MPLMHKHGGTILSLHAIAHETHKGVADWFFVGHVQWDDGTESPDARIAPYQLCCDADDAAADTTIRRAMRALVNYLGDAGDWHDAKHTRDGRIYHWTPKAKAGRAPLSLEV